jgi:hypothetical protein
VISEINAQRLLVTYGTRVFIYLVAILPAPLMYWGKADQTSARVLKLVYINCTRKILYLKDMYSALWKLYLGAEINL